MKYITLLLLLLAACRRHDYVIKPATNIDSAKYVALIDFRLAPGVDTAGVMRITRRAFKPFNIYITTDSTVKYYRRQRLILDATKDTTIAGWSYVGVIFNLVNYSNYVYPKKLPTLSRIAGTVVHELGHALGLAHQSVYDSACNLINPYRPGAYMGFPDSTCKWVKGTTYYCTAIQDDSLVLTNNLK